MRCRAASALVVAVLVTAAPAHAKDLNRAGYQQYQRGRFDKAHALFEQATRKDPKNVYPWYDLARTTFITQGKRPVENERPPYQADLPGLAYRFTADGSSKRDQTGELSSAGTWRLAKGEILWRRTGRCWPGTAPSSCSLTSRKAGSPIPTSCSRTRAMAWAISSSAPASGTAASTTYAAQSPVPPAPGELAVVEGRQQEPPVAAPARPRRIPWAELLRRVFRSEFDRCACGGRLRLVAFVTDAAEARRYLTHVGLPGEASRIAPARAPPQAELAFESC